ncbi:hypothetical protein PR048_001884 [Dryococelus australis]|uniref:Uncharacterized protein n=1 Tax=Dryococelus australis TaxID=614101 RepID=A0ABQ9IIL1_9NEOP|nr:hypothetical protein PR048_001884 [Dryococelus australis]
MTGKVEHDWAVWRSAATELGKFTRVSRPTEKCDAQGGLFGVAIHVRRLAAQVSTYKFMSDWQLSMLYWFGCELATVNATKMSSLARKNLGRRSPITASEPTCQLVAQSIKELFMERHRNEGAGENGDPRENPPTSVIVRYDYHICENSGAATPGIEPGSPRIHPVDKELTAAGNPAVAVSAMRIDWPRGDAPRHLNVATCSLRLSDSRNITRGDECGSAGDSHEVRLQTRRPTAFRWRHCCVTGAVWLKEFRLSGAEKRRSAKGDLGYEHGMSSRLYAQVAHLASFFFFFSNNVIELLVLGAAAVKYFVVFSCGISYKVADKMLSV